MLKFHPNTTVENGSNANKQLFPTNFFLSFKSFI